MALMHASKVLRHDREIVLAAVREDGLYCSMHPRHSRMIER